jgi:5-methylcytosine-specific restriction endonuclease McrA
MPWVRLDDRLAMSVKVRGLADPGVTGDRAKDQRNAALGHLMQLLTWVGGERTDGFVTADIVELFGTAASTARLLRARFDMQPLLHQRDKNGKPPSCPCLDGRAWRDDFEYLLHDYLDRNPSRAENDVDRAKKRELRSKPLKQAVRDRDWDICRYCGLSCSHSDRTSDAGLTFDHVDPEIADGINNLVVACRGCNRKKGKATPAQAGLVLRPAPKPMTVTGLVAAIDATLASAPDATPDTALGTDLSPEQQRAQPSTQTQVSPGRDGDGHGTTPPPSRLVGPPPPRFTGDPPNPYLREQRPPELHAGHPPQTEEAS